MKESYQPPKGLLIKSDDNELELVEVLPKGRLRVEDAYVYSYTKSKTKLGERVILFEDYITKMISFNWELIK